MACPEFKRQSYCPNCKDRCSTNIRLAPDCFTAKCLDCGIIKCYQYTQIGAVKKYLYELPYWVRDDSNAPT